MRAAVATCVALVMMGSVAHGQSSLQGRVGVGAASTLVYRGIPQYASTDTPSIQLDGSLRYSLDQSTVIFLDVLGASTFYERTRNADLGSADYVDVSTGVELRLSPTWQLDLGAQLDLRPHAEHLDHRKEVLVRAAWLAYSDAEVRLIPRVEIRGEVHRHLGGFGILAFRAEREMGDGFVFAGEVDGGWSYYLRSDDQFEYLSVTGEILFRTPVPNLSVAAQVTGSFSKQPIAEDIEFIGRHGIVWSSLFVRYDAF
jgi:hypothetical protein